MLAGFSLAQIAEATGLPTSYVICITVIVLEVLVIFGLVGYLLWKPKNQEGIRPGGNTATAYTGQVEEQQSVNEEISMPPQTGQSKMDINYMPGIDEQVEDETRSHRSEKSATSTNKPLSTKARSTTIEVNDDGELIIPKQPSILEEEALPPDIERTPSDHRKAFFEVEDIFFTNGWRQQVALTDVIAVDLIQADTVKLLQTGKLQPDEVAQGELKEYLFGLEPVAGFLNPETDVVHSIFSAAKDGIVRRGTAITLLEAQAATGSIIDPESGQTYSVQEASALGLLDKVHETVLVRAERAVYGYKTRLAGDNELCCLYEAMKRGIIVEQHAVRLLEAQIATGGIIDPRINMRLPLEVAISRGLFDERLLDEVKNNQGFLNPSTQENMCYGDLMENSTLIDLENNKRVRLLEFVPQSTISRGPSRISLAGSGRQSRTQSLDPANAEEIDKISLTKSESAISNLDEGEITRTKSKTSVYSHKSRRSVIVVESGDEGLIETGEIKAVDSDGNEEIIQEAHEKHSDVESILSSRSKASIHSKKSTRSAKSRRSSMSKRSKLDVKSNDFSTKKSSSIRSQSNDELRSQRLTSQSHDELKSQRISSVEDQLDEQSEKIEEEEQEEVVETVEELETEEIVEEVIEYGSEAGSQYTYEYIEEEVEQSEVESEKKSVRVASPEPQIISSAPESAPHEITGEIFSDADTSDAQQIETVESLKISEHAQNVSYREKSPQRSSTYRRVTTEFEQTTESESQYGPDAADLSAEEMRKGPQRSRHEIFFNNGWGGKATLASLYESNLVTRRTLEALEEGRLLEDEVAPHLERYLIGLSPICGLILNNTGEKVSILEATKRGYLRRGTAISLLEAQAATGAIIDPANGERMSVEESQRRGFIDRQYETVLLKAERAVFGYKSRFSNDILSVYQAMQKGSMVKNHAIRILEAQIATGGIIDPVAKHRIPLMVAREREMFDDEMADLLKNPSDENRGFFDPNTDENLTYAELLEKCIMDRDTNKLLFPYEGGSTTEALPSNQAKIICSEFFIIKFYMIGSYICTCININFLSIEERE